MGKAIQRANRALKSSLPQTPKRRRTVICNLLPRFEVDKQRPSPKTTHTGISAETKALVQNFYERDDVSRQAPGRKDVVITRNTDGQKVQIQARHLTSSFKETYAFFQTEHPEVVIGKSKFAELRPKHVLLSNKLPRNVCMCRYHENVIMALGALNKVAPGIPCYSHEFPESVLCSPPTRNCWLNLCDDCKEAGGFRNTYKCYDECTSVCWYVWKNDSTYRLCKNG